MTLVASWVRCINKKEDKYEIVMASDSRLNGGVYWDECPKIMSFGRGDCIMGFAGDTAYSYPYMLQINNAIAEYSRVKDGAISFNDLCGHFLRVLNDTVSKIKIDIPGIKYDQYINNEYIFAGYDWEKKSFIIKTISAVPDQSGKGYKVKYNQTKNHYSLSEKTNKLYIDEAEINHDNYLGFFGALAIIGDKRKSYEQYLQRVLKRKYGSNYELAYDAKFDMEPYEALCELLIDENRQGKNSTVGGAPQLLKITQYLKTRPVGVYWPSYDQDDSYKNRTLGGRVLLEYEESDYDFYCNEYGRSISCKKGMHYVDMFIGVRFIYTINSKGAIDIEIIKGKKEFFNHCTFNLRNKKLTYGKMFKIDLSFKPTEECLNYYPLHVTKSFYVPSEEVFHSGKYEVKGELVDMFECISFIYENDNQGKNSFSVKIVKDNSKEYAKYCDFAIDDKKYRYDELFAVRLKYKRAGLRTLKVEPYRYSKEYRIPDKRYMKLYEERKSMIERLTSCLSNYCNMKV